MDVFACLIHRASCVSKVVSLFRDRKEFEGSYIISRQCIFKGFEALYGILLQAYCLLNVGILKLVNIFLSIWWVIRVLSPVLHFSLPKHLKMSFFSSKQRQVGIRGSVSFATCRNNVTRQRTRLAWLAFKVGHPWLVLILRTATSFSTFDLLFRLGQGSRNWIVFILTETPDRKVLKTLDFELSLFCFSEYLWSNREIKCKQSRSSRAKADYTRQGWRAVSEILTT